MTPELLGALRRAGVEKTLTAGALLLKEGEPSGGLHVVLDGELVVSASEGAELGRCGPGTILGEVSLFDEGPVSATVAAVRATTVVSLDRPGLDALYRDDPVTATALMQAVCAGLAARIRTSSDRLERLALGEAAGEPPRRSLLAALRALWLGREEAT